ALYGLNEGIIDNTIYSVIVLMGVISVLIAPTLLRRIMKKLPGANSSQIGETCEI
ncbi:MAG: hypothetical protein IH630_09160, partial [Thermoplasmata archaeon]|nr:hypothetical protein [Thermoplasmata archaeon]